MRTEQEYRNLEAENTRLSAEVERLKQELDEALLIHQTDTGTESVVATLQARIDELEAERTWQPIETAPKTGWTILLGYRNSLGNWRTMRGKWMRTTLRMVSVRSSNRQTRTIEWLLTQKSARRCTERIYDIHDKNNMAWKRIWLQNFPRRRDRG